MPRYAICSTADWGSPDYAKEGSEAARDLKYDGYFTSLSLWEIDRDGSSVGGTTEIGEYVGDDWVTNPDTSSITLSGWTSNVEIVITVHEDLRNTTAAWNSTKLRLVSSSGGAIISNGQSNTYTIEWLQVQNTVTGDASSYGLLNSSSSSYTWQNCMSQPTGDGNGFEGRGSTSTGIIQACIACHEGTIATSSEGILITAGTSVTVNNCSTFGFNDGIERDGGTVTARNNVSFNNTDQDFDGTFSVLDYNASDDGTGTNAQTLDSTSNYANEFVDAVNCDITPVTGGSCVDNGTTVSYAVDYIGTSRPQGTSFDIGAIELIQTTGDTVTLSPTDVLNIVDDLTISQIHNLTLSANDILNIVDSLTVSGAGEDTVVLSPTDLLKVVDDLNITQNHSLTLNESVISNIVDNLTITSNLDIVTLSDTISLKTVDTLSITQKHDIIFVETTILNVVDRLNIGGDVYVEIYNISAPINKNLALNSELVKSLTFNVNLEG